MLKRARAMHDHLSQQLTFNINEKFRNLIYNIRPYKKQ